MKKSLVLTWSLVIISICAHAQEPFITTWKTDNPGTSCSSCITIPVLCIDCNYDVDWENDGVFDDLGVTGMITHEYDSAGVYTVAIKGLFPHMSFSNNGDRLKILSVDQWGDIEWRILGEMFYGCENLEILASDTPHLDYVTTAARAFSNCENITGGFSEWDVSNIRDFSGMFRNCPNFNEDIGMWDMSSATDISNMFAEATIFNQDLNNWDVSNVTDISNIFTFAQAFDHNLDQWDVSNVTDISGAFSFARSFNHDINGWDVSNVTRMAGVFAFAGSFNYDLDAWDVSNITTMRSMFKGAFSFNGDITNWDVSKVTDMHEMFSDAEIFNRDIGDWDVSSVQSMFGMFSSAESFDQDLSQWTISSLNLALSMLDNSGMMCDNYSALLISWAANPNTPNDVIFGADNLTYDDMAEEARNTLIAKGWSISGDELGECTTSLKELDNIDVSVSPNPTDGIVNIVSSEVPTSVQVINATGRTVIIFDKNDRVSLSGVPEGLYYLRIQFDGFAIMEKVVKW